MLYPLLWYGFLLWHGVDAYASYCIAINDSRIHVHTCSGTYHARTLSHNPHGGIMIELACLFGESSRHFHLEPSLYDCVCLLQSSCNIRGMTSIHMSSAKLISPVSYFMHMLCTSNECRVFGRTFVSKWKIIHNILREKSQITAFCELFNMNPSVWPDVPQTMCCLGENAPLFFTRSRCVCTRIPFVCMY